MSRPPRIVLAATTLLTSWSLASCSLFGGEPTDAERLQELAEAGAEEYGSQTIVSFSVTNIDDVRVNATFVDEAGRNVGSGDPGRRDIEWLPGESLYAGAGVPIDSIPFTDLAAFQRDAEAECEQGAVTEMVGTATGTPLVSSSCEGEFTAPLQQELAERPVAELDKLSDPAQLQTALDDLVQLVGGRVEQLAFFFISEDPDGPNLYATNVPLPGRSEGCYTSATRTLNAIRYVPYCADVINEVGDPIDLSLITADKVITAVNDLLPQLRADSIDDVQSILFMAEGDRVTISVQGADSAATATLK